jgi:putative tryptophan/tyrosine transport system ATP-binding protein
MLELRNVSVTFGKNTKLERKILHDINLTLAPAEFVMIIGSNGAGKSTLFSAIFGNIPIDEGTIIVDGQDVTHLEIPKRAQLIAKVLQDPKSATIDDMTIEENLRLALLRGKSPSLKLSRPSAMFKKALLPLNLGLENRLQEFVGNLSGGQRQALSLVMATIADFKLLLLDEITSALDPKMGDLVMDLTEKVVSNHQKTTLMITHNMSHALHYGTRTLLLHQGRIIKDFSGPSRKLLKPADLAQVFNEI